MIYTKTGDCGLSSTIADSGLYKDDTVFELLGALDELNAHMAVARVQCSGCIGDAIERLQRELVCVNAHIAGGDPFDYKSTVSLYEQCIDDIESEVEMPCSIMVFGDCDGAAYINLCRAVARRCERLAVGFVRERDFDVCLIEYLNRLSDYLFALSLKFEKIRGDKG